MARLKLTLTMESGARIGPGKAALLESVRSSGSISAAARAMGMDYKRAWLLVDSLNRAFDTPVVERVTGVSAAGPSSARRRHALAGPEPHYARPRWRASSAPATASRYASPMQRLHH